MSEQWDGKVVMSTPGGPIVELSLGEYLARKDAEIERLRAALVLGSEVLASHQGSPQREWHSGGAWLYPGDSINVVRAPLTEALEDKP